MNNLLCAVCNAPARIIVARGMQLAECTSCGLVWIIGGHEDRVHYEEKESGAKSAIRLRNSFGRIDTLSPHVNLNNLCDVGTGDGIFLAALRERGYTGSVGIEPSIEGRKAAADQGLVVFDGGIEMLSTVVTDSATRTISLFHVIEHLTDPLQALRDIYKALPYGGSLIIETPNVEAPMLRRFNLEHDLVYPEHLFLFTPRSLQRALENAGFRVVASGVRDFDDHHLSIRQSLVRLGIFPYEPTKERMSFSKETSPQPLRPSVVRDVVRFLCNQVVLLLGLVDYQWVVVVKPELKDMPEKIS